MTFTISVLDAATKPTRFAHQASLPHLPVPALEDTLERYITSLEPFLTKVGVSHRDVRMLLFVAPLYVH